ncbi:hypothetical protein EV175_000927 [Coemansia sp. RSA 1933]|nr:hypothetical protein EV175_000927 [Coemansia sp. RSA 1933]
MQKHTDNPSSLGELRSQMCERLDEQWLMLQQLTRCMQETSRQLATLTTMLDYRSSQHERQLTTNRPLRFNPQVQATDEAGSSTSVCSEATIALRAPLHIKESKASTKNRSLSASASMATLNASKGPVVSDLEAFLSSIDSFRSESRRLFPEHMALDRILGDLRDECQHRVDYMSRVSAMSALSSSPTASPAQSNASKTTSSTTAVNNSNNMATGTRRRKTTGGADSAMPLPSPSPSPSPPQLPAIATTNRRRNPPQSMFLGGILPGDEGAGGRPLSMAELNPKASFNLGRTSNRTQHMPAASGAATKSPNEYVMVVKIAGHKVEAAVSPSLQTSLISMQLAVMMGMPVTSVSPNSRVWSTGGKSWSVVGEVTGLPFVCGGNVSFSHSFKVVQGGAGANDMTRDIVLGNDFCVGNKGRIKDNRLHMEQLCMPVSVPVRPITAA